MSNINMKRVIDANTILGYMNLTTNEQMEIFRHHLIGSKIIGDDISKIIYELQESIKVAVNDSRIINPKYHYSFIGWCAEHYPDVIKEFQSLKYYSEG